MSGAEAPPEAALPASGEAQVAADRQRLKSLTVNGAAVNMASQLLRVVLMFGNQIAMARLLAPGDFGLVAMAAPVIAFVQLFSDLGLSAATVQQKTITQSQLSFLFWINVGMGALLAAITAVLAPLVAWFYGDPRVADITIIAGSLLFLGGLYSQHMALMNRNLRFTSIAAVELGSFALGAAAGITAAVLGLSYWSLVVNQAVNSVSAMLLAWIVSGWRPGRPERTTGMRALLRFGANLTGAGVVNFFARNMDNVLIGRVWGEGSLGLYDRAYKLVLLPFNQVAYPFTRVALPLLSKSQDAPDFYRNAYRRLLESVLLLTYPGLVWVLAVHQSLIVHVLGARWAGVGPIFGVLVLDAFVAPIGQSMGWLFISQGRTREMRNWGIVASVLFVSCFVAGLHWGPVGVASGYVVAGFIELAALWHIATRTGPLRGESFFGLLHPFLAGALAAYGALYGLAAVISPGWIMLGVSGVISYAVFALVMLALPAGRRTLLGVLAQARGFLPRRLTAVPASAG